jgi:hypothetical protein
MRVRILVTVTISFLFGIASGFWIARQISIDGCLDRGGRWSEIYAMCEL